MNLSIPSLFVFLLLWIPCLFPLFIVYWGPSFLVELKELLWYSNVNSFNRFSCCKYLSPKCYLPVNNVHVFTELKFLMLYHQINHSFTLWFHAFKVLRNNLQILTHKDVLCFINSIILSILCWSLIHEVLLYKQYYVRTQFYFSPYQSSHTIY